jgi:branched-chain amino acid transport system ATP-binding protein
MNLLELKEITKSFGSLVVVNKLSFEVNDGEILGIAGPNGAGKTTLFNLITGIYNYEGKIFFRGEDITSLRPYIICQKAIARTFQIPLVFSTITVYENIGIGACFGKKNRTDGKNIIENVLEFVGLQEKANQLTENLRLFDKKMTMLAAALATRPKLLLLDEPAGGLNTDEITQSISIFKKINSELGITIIIVEHLMKVLLGSCQRMMILHNGEQVCIGSPEKVMKDKKVIEIYLGEDYAKS